jgi:hypothetical protein
MLGPLDILSVHSFSLYLLVDGGGDNFLASVEVLGISLSDFFRVDCGGTTPLTPLDRFDVCERDSIDNRDALLNKSGAFGSAPFILDFLDLTAVQNREG